MDQWTCMVIWGGERRNKTETGLKTIRKSWSDGIIEDLRVFEIENAEEMAIDL